MRRSLSHAGLSWLDVKKPDQNDISFLEEQFNIHPLVIEEFTTPTYQPKAIFFENCLYLAVHVPLFNVEERTTYSGEVDIILTRDHVITGHWDQIWQLEKFFTDLEESPGRRRLHLSESPAHLVYQVLEILLNSCFPRLEHIAKRLDWIEEQVFAGREKEMVREISVVKRDILNFRRALKPSRAIIESVIQKPSPLVPEAVKTYFQDLIGTNIRLWNILENNKEIIESLEDTNNSLLSNKLDQTMKVLTLFSAILLPLTVYSNILAMSASIPFGSNPNAFWIHMSIMVAISLITVTVFRRKGWF